MNRQPLSIRTLLLLTISLLTLLVTLLVAREVYMQWQRLEIIIALKEATILSDQLFDSTEKLAKERDIAFTMLYAPTPDIIQELAPRLERNRKSVDQAFQATLQAMAPYAFAELIELRQKIETQLTDIRGLRPIIDQAIALPKQQRDKALATRWYDEATALTLQTQKLWLGFLKHFTDIDSRATQHMRFKYFLRTISAYTGQERAIIARLLVENADPTPGDIAQLLEARGIIGVSWDTSAVLAEQSGLFPTIAPEYADAKSHYLTMADMTRNIFYVPGVRNEGVYPISVDLWFELSTQADESLRTLNIAAFQETRRYVEELEMQARQAIIGHSAFLLAVLALCGYSLWIITRRVIRPINTMVEALVDTMQGKPTSFAFPAGNSQDEIGQLAQVLRAFQANVEQVQRATAELEQSENKLRAVVEHILDGLITINEKGAVESFNPACERIFGYKAEEVIGRNVKMLMPEPYHSEHDGYISHYVHTGEARIIGTAGREVTAKRKDGSVFPMDLSISAFTLGDGRHFSGIIRDITARKEAERKIQESQERYRALVESSSQVIWVWKQGALDPSSPLSQWWEETTGQPAAMIATFGWLEVVHPDDRDQVRKIWEDAMAHRKNFDMEYRLRARGGNYLHVAIRGVALLAADGSVNEFIGSLNDITARKEAEAELLSYTRALERSNKELDDFAYIASHDLKEPLRGIHNHSRFLLEDNQDKLDKDSIDKLGRLVYLSQRMERLVNDLLYFSRLGRQEMAIQPTNINDVVRDIETTLELFLAERKARIMTSTHLPVITCDKPRITELLRNLITNAVKYNDKPNKVVEIGFMPDYFSPHRGSLHNVFYVRDNGKGIAPEFHEEIFRIFKRLQSTKDGAEEGTGVGLTFVKKIIERHGGVIFLESEPGKGTTFYFTLEGQKYDTAKAA